MNKLNCSWFDFCYSNPELVDKFTLLQKVTLDEIILYNKEVPRGDYSAGGFYLIKNKKTAKSYVGKGVNVFKRLKDHYTVSKCNRGIFVDSQMYGCIEDFEFYIISFYSDIGINFFTRKLEVPMEQYYIKLFKSAYPNGYNIQVYESLSIKPAFLGLFV